MATAKAKMAAPAAEVKNGHHPLPWLNLVVTEPFYLLHLLLFFSYFVVRSSAVQDLSLDLSRKLLRREIQAILTFSVLTAVKQPPYDGVGESSYLTPLQLETLFAEGNTSRFWLVEFRVLCSPTCIRTSRIFPDLSIIYSNKNISFGIVDLGLFPNAAENFGISLSGPHPTYILYENAVEVTRFPGINIDKKAFRPAVTKSLLCQHFELDKRLIEYISN